MRRTRDEWAKIVERFEESGLKVGRFSQREGVTEQSLRIWTRRLGEGRTVAEETETGSFVEIRTPGRSNRTVKSAFAEKHGQGLAIRFPMGAVIEVRPGTDRKTLEWVLAVMAGVTAQTR